MTQDIIRLLTQPVNSKQFIESNYQKLLFKTGYKVDYQFSMMLPISWKAYPETVTQYPSEEMPIGLVGKVSSGNPASLAEIDLWCALIPRELNPSDWLYRWLETQDYQVKDSRVVPSEYGQLGDCIAYKTINDKQHTCRLFTIKDKNRIFLFIGKTLSENYKEHEESFLLALQSLVLLNPTKELYAEPFKEEDINAPYQAVLRFPSLWDKKVETAESKDEMSLSLINREGNTLLGQINIVLLSATLNLTYHDLIGTWIDKLKANGLTVRGNSKTAKSVNNGNKTITSWQGEASSEGVPVELQSNIIEHEKGFLMLNLITSPASYAYENWAINRRAYEILYNTVRY